MQPTVQAVFVRYWRELSQCAASLDPRDETEFAACMRLMLRNQWRLSGPISIQALARATGLSYSLLAQPSKITDVSQRKAALSCISTLLAEYADQLEKGTISLDHF